MEDKRESVQVVLLTSTLRKVQEQAAAKKQSVSELLSETLENTFNSTDLVNVAKRVREDWWKFMNDSGQKIGFDEFLKFTELSKSQQEMIIDYYKDEPGLADVVFDFIQACKK